MHVAAPTPVQPGSGPPGSVVDVVEVPMVSVVAEDDEVVDVGDPGSVDDDEVEEDDDPSDVVVVDDTGLVEEEEDDDVDVDVLLVLLEVVVVPQIAVIVPRPRTMKLLRSLTSTLSDAIMNRRNGKWSRAAVAGPPSPS
jgi:hypothetical protein